LKKAVEKRLLADVPVGVFLSGGLDSSLVAAFISKKNIQAFTIGFEEEESDESESAKKIAEHLGIKQNLYVFPHREAIALFPKVMSLMDEPMADPSILPTYLLSAFAQKKVKVALSGDGGDETFLGYPKYLAHFWLKKTNLEKINVSLLAKIFSPKINSFLFYSYLPLYLRNQFWLNSLPQDKIEKLTGQRLNLEDLERFHHDFSGKDNLDETFFLDQKLTLAEQFLVKIDRASMFNGLEVRCPFLDKDLVEYSAQIPFELKIKWFKTKSILREIAKDYLPKEITTLPKKGFGVPLKRWLKYDLKDFVGDYLSLKRMKKEGLLNTNIVKGILKENDPFTIWKLLAFEIWVEKWLRN